MNIIAIVIVSTLVGSFIGIYIGYMASKEDIMKNLFKTKE